MGYSLMTTRRRSSPLSHNEKRSGTTRLRCFALYLAGKTLSDVAREVGLARQTLSRWASEGHWAELREETERQIAQRLMEATVDDMAEWRAGQLEQTRRLMKVVQRAIDKLLGSEKPPQFKSAEGVIYATCALLRLQKDILCWEIPFDSKHEEKNKARQYSQEFAQLLMEQAAEFRLHNNLYKDSNEASFAPSPLSADDGGRLEGIYSEGDAM